MGIETILPRVLPGGVSFLFSGRNCVTDTFRQCQNQLAAKIRDIRHYPAPDQIAFAKGGLIRPGPAGVDNIVLDAEGTGRPAASYYIR